MSNYHIAILEINPNAQFQISGDGEESLDTINQVNGTTPIAKADIIAKEAVINVRDAHLIPREKAYPSIKKQLDMQYHDEVNGTTTWKDAIAKVKSDNPKGQSS